MIIVDKKLEELEKEKRPIRVGLVGAGFAGRGFMLQMLTAIKGMRLVAVSNRTRSFALQGFKQANYKNYKSASGKKEFENIIKSGKTALTNDPFLLTDSPQIDVIVEATGEVEFGAQVVTGAIENKKHVVLINAELDSTIGPILKVKADEAGVVYTQADGDQPAALMNLYRQVESWGFKPVMVGNIKSLIDVRRTPETQEKWAKEHFQRPKMVTSFADGTKIGAEMATIANATGFPVSKRGMEGPKCTRVEDAHKLFDLKKLKTTGLTDYILGAEPSFGVFVLATCDQPIRARYMNVYKMGEGPLYTFYIPYHLSPIEAPMSVARAVLFKDAALAPKGAPVCDVVALAKRNIKKGEKLDGIGGFLTYGAIENTDICLKNNLLPIGLADGCIATRDIPMDTAITYDMVQVPEGRLSDKLRDEQNEYFFKEAKEKIEQTFMVGIPTCYGGESLINTVKTLRQSKDVPNFRIVIVADRTPIKKSIQIKLEKMGAEIYWNDVEGSQFKKLKQLINKCDTDIFVFTQDDITFEKYTLRNILNRFKNNPEATMVSTRVLPLNPVTLFESIKAAETRIHDTITRLWNNADNYFASSGRCISFKTEHIKKFRIPETIVNGDTYLYFENKRLKGIHLRQESSKVYIRCPQRLKDELGPSSRYQFSKKELTNYFNDDLSPEYKIPFMVLVRAFLTELISHPIYSLLLIIEMMYLRVKKLPVSVVADPVWKVDLSTKRIN